MNTHDEDQPAPIQVLVTAASGFDTAPGCFWLHGFCLLTCTFENGDFAVTDILMTGERFADDKPVIEALTQALDENAVLAGLDLTAMIGALGRLPIDAEDQRPALELLRKLCAMLIKHDPIDLILSEQSQSTLMRLAKENDLSLREKWVGEGADSRPALRGVIDNANPARLPLELAHTAGACLLAITELYVPHLRETIATGEHRWRSKLQIAPYQFGPLSAERP